MNASPPLAAALILAGGRGTRIAAQHPDVPKPMIPAAGVPFLEWLVRRLAHQNIGDIVLSTGYKADIIKDWAQKYKGAKLTCRHEEQPLGTGGAIADALPHITAPLTVILNGDTLLLAELKPALETMQRQKSDGVIFARAVEDAGRYGSLDVAGGMLRGFYEKRPGRGLINGGIYVFSTAWLRQHLPKGPASFETDTLPRFIAEGARIGVIETTAPFIDIGTPESLAAADAFIAANRAAFK